MIPIALASLCIGIAVGFTLARRFMLRTLVGLICALVGLICFVVLVPADTLPGDGYAILIAAFLIAPPMASGLFGGGVFAWLLRPRSSRP